MGTRIAATLGWSDESFDADRDALIYTLAGNYAIGTLEKRALLTTAIVNGRHEDGETANATTNLNARYYSRQSEKRLWFALLDVVVGHNLDLDNPVEIGGDTGLRGYPLRYQSGDSKLLFTIEQRYFTDWYPWRLFRVGGAVFADVGRVWGNDPLGGPNLGWLKDVGFGLRFAPTRLGTRKVIHLDIAFPLDGDPTIDSVQILLEAKRSF
jgi:hemolysin activation/secretion protein